MEHPDLFPAEPPEPLRNQQVPLEELPEFPNVRAPGSFVRDIERAGLLDAIKVVRRPPDGWDVRDGKRRVVAARALKWRTIRADVYEVTPTTGAVITLVSNYHRAQNPVAEYLAIKELMAQPGMGLEYVASELGISLKKLERRLSLSKLVPGLLSPFLQGGIRATVAERAAKLEASRQEELVRLWNETGRLTGRDVAAVLQVAAKAAAAELPDSLFDGPGLEAEGGGVDWGKGPDSSASTWTISQGLALELAAVVDWAVSDADHAGHLSQDVRDFSERVLAAKRAQREREEAEGWAASRQALGELAEREAAGNPVLEELERASDAAEQQAEEEGGQE